jgi:hypothetical protein
MTGGSGMLPPMINHESVDDVGAKLSYKIESSNRGILQFCAFNRVERSRLC